MAVNEDVQRAAKVARGLEVVAQHEAGCRCEKAEYYRWLLTENGVIVEQRGRK